MDLHRTSNRKKAHMLQIYGLQASLRRRLLGGPKDEARTLVSSDTCLAGG